MPQIQSETRQPRIIQFNPEDYKQMPMGFYCPECGIHLAEEGLQYSCYTNGREWGRAYFVGYNYLETECNDSETSDSDDYSYECSSCGREISDSPINNISRKISDLLEVEQNRIEITLEQARERQPFSNNPQQWRYPIAYTENYKQFHEEAYEILRKAALLGEIEPWDYTAECYREYSNYTESRTLESSVPSLEEAIAEIATVEEEDPENHSPVIEGHHQRWWRYCQYPSGIVTCPNQKCHYSFQADREDIKDLICPQCQHEFDATKEENIGSNGTTTFRPVGTGRF